MEKIILYVDDATYACEQFAELAPDANSVVARHWVLVACAQGAPGTSRRSGGFGG